MQFVLSHKHVTLSYHLSMHLCHFIKAIKLSIACMSHSHIIGKYSKRGEGEKNTIHIKKSSKSIKGGRRKELQSIN